MSESTRIWFEEAHKDLTDDERIAENKRKQDVKRRIKEQQTDTGYED